MTINDFMEFTVKHPDTVTFCGAYLALMIWGLSFLLTFKRRKK